MIYFLSDPHFGHALILEFEPKRKEVLGDTIEQHDDALLKRINSRVKVDDILIITGDFSLASGDAVRKYRDRINSKNVMLILGNHDKHSVTYYYKCGFSVVCYEMTLKISGEFVRLRHHPYRKPWYKVLFPWQYKEKDRVKRPKNTGGWLLHGHTHSQSHALQGKQINVGVDLHKFYPISIREVESIIAKEKQKQKNKQKENLFCLVLEKIENLSLRCRQSLTKN